MFDFPMILDVGRGRGWNEVFLHPDFYVGSGLLHLYRTRDFCFFGVTHHPKCFRLMAGTTGLEPATSAVTGQRSNQLSYVPTSLFRHYGICHIESSVSQLSLFSLVSTLSLLWTQFWASIDTKQTPKNQHRNDKIKSIR